MANNSIHGRVIDDQGTGIAGLTVRGIDFDPFFNEDDVLGAVKTDGDGRFTLSYSPDAYRTWKADRNPDLVVQVLGPPHADPALFGTRLLHKLKRKVLPLAQMLHAAMPVKDAIALTRYLRCDQRRHEILTEEYQG